VPQAYMYHILVYAIVSTLIWSLEDWFFIIILLACPFAIESIRFNLGSGQFSIFVIAFDYLGILIGYCVIAIWGETGSLRIAKRKRGRLKNEEVT
jgi:Na+-driven multidrug efflux pump